MRTDFYVTPPLMLRTALALLTCFAAGLFAAAPAFGGVLDQQQSEKNLYFSIAPDERVAQTITAGATGALDQVDLMIGTANGNCALTVEIQTVTGGLPSETVLTKTAVAPGQLLPASVSLAPETGTFVPVVFSDPASVVAGTQYAIVLSHQPAASNCESFVLYKNANPYTRGSKPEFFMGGPWMQDEENDLAFRTYVSPPPAPTAECQNATVSKIDGTEGNDNLVGTINADAIFGLGGNDELDGVDGDDCLDGGDGDDRASGGADDDLVKGGDGRDKVRGVGGKDRLKGQGGADRVNGGEGSDKLSGGRGADKLNGGGAKDRFKGNSGDDDLNAVDAKTDRVNCGAGEDKAVVDPIDRVSANCETVREVGRD